MIATGVVAASMLLLVYTLRNQDSNLAVSLTVGLAMIASTFLLFAIAFALLLPLGVIDALARESSAPSESPFATDRLPEQQLLPKDIEQSH
jgi:hypothetical protein